MQLFLLASLFFTLLLAGCGGEKEEELSVGEIVARSTQKTSALKSFHFVLTVENAPPAAQGLNLTFAEGDLVVPDRLQARVMGTLSGIALESELIVVGDQYFLKDPFREEWRKLKAGANPVAFFDPAKGVLAIIGGATDLEKAGSGEVGGANSYRLRGKVRASDLTSILGNPPSQRLADVELWVGKGDLLLRRIRLEGPVSEREPENVVRTVEISDFDKPVEIEPPGASP